MSSQKHPVAHKLWVAVDFKPDAGVADPVAQVSWRALELVMKLAPLGVGFKFNSGLRANSELARYFNAGGARLFADLKLHDVGSTITTDGMLLNSHSPEVVTVFCSNGSKPLSDFTATVPNTQVAGITVLTSVTDQECKELYGCERSEAVLRHARIGVRGELETLVCSANDIARLKSELGDQADGLKFITPGIKPSDGVANDSQNTANVVTPTKALQLGSDEIVVGSAIIKAKNPFDATVAILDEMDAPGLIL